MIKIEGLNKSYNKNIVLNDLNLSIQKGKIYALIGLNGAGKSTLLEIICGIRKYDSGTILIAGNDIRDRKFKNNINKIIGYMPQSFGMFNDLTVKENLEYICTVYNIRDKSIIEKHLVDCNLKSKENILAKNLSGGYRQLLSLATSIIHNPSLIILDEPTSAMDPLFRQRFWNIIHNLNKNGATILVTTHYIEEINECDNLILLANGKTLRNIEVDNMFENGKFKNINDMINYYIIEGAK